MATTITTEILLATLSQQPSSLPEKNRWIYKLQESSYCTMKHLKAINNSGHTEISQTQQ
jgi:hypothetical protein